MAKKKKRRYSMTIPLAPIIGLAAGMAKPAQKLMAGDIEGAIEELSWNYLGYSPARKQFDITALVNGTLPLVVGLLVHKFVGGAPLNFNKILAAAKVPFIRI